MLRSAVSVFQLLTSPELSQKLFLKTHAVLAIVDIMRDVKFVISLLRDRVYNAESPESRVSCSKVYLSGPNAICKAELWCPVRDTRFIGHCALVRCSFDSELWTFDSVEDEIRFAVEEGHDLMLQFATYKC